MLNLRMEKMGFWNIIDWLKFTSNTRVCHFPIFRVMIRNPAILAAFEQREIAGTPADPADNMRIFNELYQFAMTMGKFSASDPLEGIETKVRLAKILRSVSRTP